VPLLLLGPRFFCANRPVDHDDRHLLAHAMACDFSVAWQAQEVYIRMYCATDQGDKSGRIFAFGNLVTLGSF
jgi:hypothetical protein